jgi:hypothetical protein
MTNDFSKSADVNSSDNPSSDIPANESWFARWRRKRDQDRESRFDVLLGEDAKIDTSQLIELACMDLIEQRRSGKPVIVEDYLNAYRQLNVDSCRLDLIDAEICVRQERNDTFTLEQWSSRFPDDVGIIQSLLMMDHHATPSDKRVSETDSSELTMVVAHESGTSASFEISLGGDPSSSSYEDFSIEQNVRTAIVVQENLSKSEEPVDALGSPDWFLGQKVYASGPGWWVVRGIHRDTHETFALKVIVLPSTVTPSQIRRLTEVISHASQVRHPAWIAAESSTIFNGHLGVLRPWIHGVSWNDQTGNASVVLGRLSTLAMSVAGAIADNAHHGGLHAGNLWIDHENKLNLVDAGSSSKGVHRWLTGGVGDFMTREERAIQDCQDLRALIASTLIRFTDPAVGRVLEQIRRTDLEPDEIGKILRDAADGKALKPTSNTIGWQSRLAKFISWNSRRLP